MPMPRIIRFTLQKLVTMILPLVLLAVWVFVPMNCHPSRDPELDKPLFEDHRYQEMDPATAKTGIPGPGRHLVKPSEVWKN
jgi:hypothetical protein